MQNQEKFLELLKSPYNLDEQSLQWLESYSALFPYCQSLQILLAKNLQNYDKLAFEAQVNKASAHAVDRRKFQRYISDRDNPMAREIAHSTTPKTQLSATRDKDENTVAAEDIAKKIIQKQTRKQEQKQQNESFTPSTPLASTRTTSAVNTEEAPTPEREKQARQAEPQFTNHDIKNQEGETTNPTDNQPSEQDPTPLPGIPAQTQQPAGDKPGEKTPETLLALVKRRISDIKNRVSPPSQDEPNSPQPVEKRTAYKKSTTPESDTSPADDKKPEKPGSNIGNISKEQGFQKTKSSLKEDFATKETSGKPTKSRSNKEKNDFHPYEKNSQKPDINELIDKFLKEKPRIEVKKELPEEQEDLSEESTTEAPDLATETLANVYLKQGKMEKALEIFERLCLKFPEKSSYFAKKILDIKNGNNY